MLTKRVASLGAVQSGSFMVDCETYSSVPSLGEWHLKLAPLSSFALVVVVCIFGGGTTTIECCRSICCSSVSSFWLRHQTGLVPFARWHSRRISGRIFKRVEKLFPFSRLFHSRKGQRRRFSFTTLNLVWKKTFSNFVLPNFLRVFFTAVSVSLDVGVEWNLLFLWCNGSSVITKLIQVYRLLLLAVDHWQISGLSNVYF